MLEVTAFPVEDILSPVVPWTAISYTLVLWTDPGRPMTTRGAQGHVERSLLDRGAWKVQQHQQLTLTFRL